MTSKDKANRTIDTGGGAYIEGNVTTGGGDFVGRDKITQQAGASLEGLAQLMAEMRAALPQTQMSDDTREAIEGEFTAVETQLAKPAPKKFLVLPKLEGIVKVLTGAVAAGEAVQKLLPMAQQAMQWAQQVLK
jgi:hypothetical protein